MFGFADLDYILKKKIAFLLVFDPISPLRSSSSSTTFLVTIFLKVNFFFANTDWFIIHETIKNKCISIDDPKDGLNSWFYHRGFGLMSSVMSSLFCSVPFSALLYYYINITGKQQKRKKLMYFTTKNRYVIKYP